MGHPWCSDIERDKAIRAAENAAAKDRTPLPDHRELPERMARLERVVAQIRAESDTQRTLSSTSETQAAILHIDTGETIDEEQDHARLDAVAGGTAVVPGAVAPRVTPEADGGAAADSGDAEVTAPASRPAVMGGMRTERVTLEIVTAPGGHEMNETPRPLSEWVSEEIASHLDKDRGESICVVKPTESEEVRDLRLNLAWAEADRCAAIRERDEARARVGKVKMERDGAKRTVAELEARVAELEAVTKSQSISPATEKTSQQPLLTAEEKNAADFCAQLLYKNYPHVAKPMRELHARCGNAPAFTLTAEERAVLIKSRDAYGENNDDEECATAERVIDGILARSGNAPTFTLTAEEREAVELALSWLPSPYCEQFATLRGLLARAGGA